MQEGEIIKFYRKKVGMSQEQLGKDICTSTHVSKIERGQTKYSKELISLFSNRLGIDIVQEIEYLKGIHQKLEKWQTAIIKQSMKKVDLVKVELEQFPSIRFSKHAILYQLLLARYYLLHNEGKSATTIVKVIGHQGDQMSTYEKNLYKHVLALCYLNRYNSFETENKKIAIELLESIEQDEYENEEYYYHLAIAYHWVKSHTMAYINAEKALNFFKRTNNFGRAIQAESVMLLQEGSVTNTDFNKKVERYHDLMDNCDTLDKPLIKAMLFHNLGYEYFLRKEYSEAHQYYGQALLMADKKSSIYLNRLFNYLSNGIEGEILSNKKLAAKAKEGYAISKTLKNPLYTHLFTLLLLKLQNNDEKYYEYIEQRGLPFFERHNHFSMIKKFGKQLYHHYVQTREFEKAVQVAGILMNQSRGMT